MFKKKALFSIFLVSLLLVILVIPFINFVKSSPAILHVDGTQIKDSLGNIVHLRGVNYDSDEWWGTPSLGAEQLTYMKNWGCTAVRISVQCYTLEANKAGYGTGLGNPSFMSRLDNIISWATSVGLYVILNGFHTSTGNCPHGIANNHLNHYLTVDWTWAEWVTIWDTYSTRYASYSNVLYELINEPLYVSYTTYQTEMRAAIDAIRTHNPNAICLVQEAGSADWETFSLQYEQTNPISRSNVIYVIHDYAYHFSDNSQSIIRWKLGSNGAYTHYAYWMLANDRCVMATEFGGGYNGNQNPTWNSWQTVWIQNFMAVLDADGYSGYTAQRWATVTSSCGKLLNDWYGNPTTYGQTVRSVFLSFYTVTTTATYISTTTTVYGTSTFTSTFGTTTSTITGGGTPVFSDGFESGSFSAWTSSVGSSSVQSSVKKSGTYAALFTATASHVNEAITGTTLYAVEDVQIHTLPSAYTSVDLMRFETAGFSNLVEIYFVEWLGTYYLNLHFVYPTPSDYGYAFSLTADTWYNVKMKFVQSATVGEYRVWLNGVEVITETGLNTNSAVVGYFEAGSVYSSYTTNLYVDDVYLYDADPDITTTLVSGTATFTTTLYTATTSTSSPPTTITTATTSFVEVTTSTAYFTNVDLFWSPQVNFRFSDVAVPSTFLFFDDWAVMESFQILRSSINFTNLQLFAVVPLTEIGLKIDDGNLTIKDAGDYQLTLSPSGDPDSTAVFYVYCFGYGEPSEVIGATDYSYAGGVLTFHNDLPAYSDIIIRWEALNFIDQYFPLMIFIVGFICFFLPLGVIFWRRPDPATCIKLVMVSFIGFAVLMFSGSA